MPALLVLAVFSCLSSPFSSAPSARWTPLGVLVIVAVLVWQVAPTPPRA